MITREEMIELLKDGDLLAEYTCNVALSDRYQKAIASLQAAEPVGYGLKGLLTKQWDGKTFVEKEDADSYEEVALLPLFALPCPPAKAQVPEGYAGVTVWAGDRQVTQIVSQTELVSSNADELLRRFENARHLLTASPAPGSQLEDTEQ